MQRTAMAGTACSAVALCALPLVAQTTIRASVDSAGAQANGFSDAPVLSADARFVAFYSIANNLVPGDTNSVYDVFVRDRLLGTTVRASVNSSGVQGSGGSITPSISADGRFVAFHSASWNLVSADNNFRDDAFVRDLVAGTTERVSVSSTGVESDAACFSARISGDGRYVAFDTQATTLVSSGTNGVGNVFVHDRQTSTTELASVGIGGAASNGLSHFSSISFDGRYLAFVSAASNLVSGDTNGVDDVFVRDLSAHTTVLASVDSSGAQGHGASAWPSISGDGRYVVFESDSDNLVPADTNGKRDVFLRDLQSGTTSLVSVDSIGTQSNGLSQVAKISANARWVAFNSEASNLVPGDTNNKQDIFLRDLQTGVTERVSVGASGAQTNGHTYLPAIDAEGHAIAFNSVASNLIAGDTNNQRDVFVRERFLAPTTYCTAGTTSHGCVPSIASVGSPSASASSGFVLSASNVEGQRTGLFFYGLSGAVAWPWGTGSTSFMCVKSPTQRTSAQNSGGTFSACDGSLAIDLLAFLAANPNALGQPVAMGQRFDAQAWFRDPPAPKTTNLSNAIEFDLVP